VELRSWRVIAARDVDQEPAAIRAIVAEKASRAGATSAH
jgi:hypothetical protein